MTRAVWRFRLVATCTALTALAFVQSPALVAADTKLDLTQDPWSFLGRALHLWNPDGFFGQLQNQAYGYLFPIGPFFGVLHSVGVPGWVVQRLWWAVLLCAAFLGTVRLARLLGVTGPAARWAAGLAFALTPRVVTTIGPISSETLAVVLAPWVLIPLLHAAQGSRRLGPRRAAALSGCAVLLAGGVNATATAAVLVLPALWFLTRARSGAAKRLAAWWVLCVGLASLWWAIPLLLLGRYSPRFLDWIESAAVTTGRSDLATALRGTNDWVAYVAGAGGPSWPAGWQLVSTAWLVAVTGLVAAFGLYGVSIARRERRFLLSGVLVGLILITLGHTGWVAGLGAGGLQDALDGVLSPLRNTHKFDVVARLPLSVGIGWALTAVSARLRRSSWAPLRQAAAAGVVPVLVLVAAWPALEGGLTRDRTFASIPQYWRDAADYVGSRGPGTALIVPGAPFGTYLWGRPQDEPMQVMASGPWAVRDAVPLSSAGNIRLLDAVESRLSTGRGSPGLAEALARSGVRWLVVRNDLDTVEAQSPRSVLIHEALATTPGVRFAAGFGPPIVPFGTERTIVDYRLDAAYPAVEVYSVSAGDEPDDPRAVLRDATSVVHDRAGTSDGLLDLADASLLGGAPTVLGYDLPGGTSGTSVVSDTYRRAEHDFGRVHDSRSETMTPDQSWVRDRHVHDYPGGPTSRPATSAIEGVDEVSASSTQAAVGTVDGSVPGAGPWAALDLDLATAWEVRDLEAADPSWWEVRFEKPTDVRGLQLALMTEPVMGVAAAGVTVVTDAGRTTDTLAGTQELQEVVTPTGPTTTLRLELAAPSSASGVRTLGLREVVVPGLVVGRPVSVPAGDGSGGIVLTARAGDRDGCVTVPLRFPCASTLPRPGEDARGIDRLVTLSGPGEYDVHVTVRPRDDSDTGRLLDPLVPAVRAEASSVLVEDPRNRPQAAVDRDPSTAWIAGVGDTAPTLTLRLPEKRQVTGLQLQTEPDAPASRPFLLTVGLGGRTYDVAVDQSGAVELPPTVVDQLSVRFRGSTALSSIDLQRGLSTRLPVGVSEVLVRGALDLGRTVDRGAATGVPCGFGPVVEIDGAAASQTRVGTTVGAVLTGRRIAATPCDGAVVLTAGSHRIRALSTSEFSVESVVLRPRAAGAPATKPVPARIVSWDVVDRSVEVAESSAPRTLETSENANAGWVAELEGTRLEPVVVDGWRQAWLLPDGLAGQVHLVYEPDRTYRAGLAVGGLAALILLLLALWPLTRGGGECIAPGPPARATSRVPLSAVAGVAVPLVVGGLIGLAAGLLGAGLQRAVGRSAAVLGLGGVGAAIAAVAPWPASATVLWPGAAASLLGIAALAAAAWPSDWPPSRRSADEPTQA